MSIAGSLLTQITVLFLIMALGMLLVKLRIVRSEDSRILSMVTIYIIQPCVIIRAFQIEFTREIRDGFLLAVGAAVAINLILMLLTWGYGKLFRLDAVERTSIMYANTGNLIIPLVTAILGGEWVIYASAFMCVQLVFLCTHGQAQISGEKKGNWKKILLNINLIAVAAGMALLFLGIRLPWLVTEVCGQMSDTMGPVTMLMIGMLLADVRWRELLTAPRNYVIMALKMVITPLMILLLIRLSGAAALVPEGRTVLYMSFMAVITPCAATVTQLAQIHRNRPAYASALNALTTLVSIATMPLMTWLYWLVI